MISDACSFLERREGEREGVTAYKICNSIRACVPLGVCCSPLAGVLLGLRMKAMVGVGVEVRVEKRVIRSERLGFVREEGVRRRKGWCC